MRAYDIRPVTRARERPVIMSALRVRNRHRDPMTKTRLLCIVVLCLSLVALTACGEDLEPSAADRAATQAERELAARGPIEEPQPIAAEKVTPPAGEADIEEKPKIARATGEPPSELVAQDLIEGTGAVVKSGDQITVEYVGVLFSSGKEIDSSWGREPFTFTLGSGNVIDGWVQGIPGMKQGGRRKLIIPPDLAYGETGDGADIPPDATLIFDIDLKKIG